jgi:hypothetical protein
MVVAMYIKFYEGEDQARVMLCHTTDNKRKDESGYFSLSEE